LTVFNYGIKTRFINGLAKCEILQIAVVPMIRQTSYLKIEAKRLLITFRRVIHLTKKNN